MADTGKILALANGLLGDVKSEKLNAPTNTGTAGQVLGLDNNLAPKWIDQTGGGGSIDPSAIAEAVADWCDENITEDPTVVIDTSLLVSGAAADAKAAGDRISLLEGGEHVAEHVTPVFTFTAKTSTIESNTISCKAGDTIKFQRTSAASGKVYGTVSLHTIVNGTDTYSNLTDGNTATIANDCQVYLGVFKVSTSTVTLSELCELAPACFTGSVTSYKSCDLIDDIGAIHTELGTVDSRIADAVAPALGGNITINPTWTDGYYYNSSLESASNSACKIAKVDVSAYINASLSMTTYANSSAFCGFTDKDDAIIKTWHQTSAESRTIPINAKYLYITNVPANLAPAVFACAVTLSSIENQTAYLDVAMGIKEYDEDSEYVVGNLCRYAGTLKRCIADTTGTYDPDDWQNTTIFEELGLRDNTHPITKLNGLSWKACGDSITAGSNGSSSYVPLMAELLGITTYTNSGVGGAYLETAYNGAAVTDDFVTLLGGTNDFGLSTGAKSLTDFETSVRTIISNFRTNNQTARLYMITPIPRFDKTTNEYSKTLLDYVEVMEEVCSELNVPCLNLYERIGFTAENKGVYLKNDQVHPDTYGAVRIAVEIANFVSEMEAIHRVVAFR